METRDKNTVTYYYSRDKRLERASANANFIVDRYGAKRPGIIRSLTATRSLRYLFFAVIFMMVALLVVNYAVSGRDRGSIAGISLSTKAMWFEGYVYVTVKKGGPKTGGPIEIKAGDGLGSVVGFMQAGDDEARLRFAAETKPARIAVVASVSTDGTVSSVELLAKVE